MLLIDGVIVEDEMIRQTRRRRGTPTKQKRLEWKMGVRRWAGGGPRTRRARMREEARCGGL